MKVLLGILLIPWTAMFRGYVLKQLWEWFFVQQFHAPPISIPLALGISLLIGYLTADNLPRKDDNPWWYSFAFSFVVGLLVLGVGWVYRMFL